MQLRTGFLKQVINLNKVVVDKQSGQYSFELNYETVSSKGSSPPTQQTFFILASTSTSLTNKLMANNNLLLPYVRHTKIDPSITVATDLGSRKKMLKTKKSGYINKIEVKQDKIRNLTL